MKSRKVSLLVAIIVGILSGALTFTGITFATENIQNPNNSLTTQDIKELKKLESIVNELYYEDTADVDYITGLKKGLVSALDDHYSHYLTAEEYKQSMEQANGNFEGIGIVIAPSEDGYILVISPVKDSPADKAGIKAGDKIIGVNGKKYNASTITQAKDNMRGEKGTKVEVEVLSPDGNKNKYTITRDEIKAQTVHTEIMSNDIAYIAITSFDDDTGTEFSKAWNELQKKNPKSLIIDLRNNPGGLVDQVIEVAERILPSGDIFYTNNKSGKKEVFSVKNKDEIKLPIVVLVNENSASASEILSGALQDNKKATIIGQQTFGKGLVQSMFQISNDDALIITVSQYFTPNGNPVNKVGIKPDIEVLSKLNTKDKDVQIETAIKKLKN